jgi:hypothetical protein
VFDASSLAAVDLTDHDHDIVLSGCEGGRGGGDGLRFGGGGPGGSPPTCDSFCYSVSCVVIYTS